MSFGDVYGSSQDYDDRYDLGKNKKCYKDILIDGFYKCIAPETQEIPPPEPPPVFPSAGTRSKREQGGKEDKPGVELEICADVRVKCVCLDEVDLIEDPNGDPAHPYIDPNEVQPNLIIAQCDRRNRRKFVYHEKLYDYRDCERTGIQNNCDLNWRKNYWERIPLKDIYDPKLDDNINNIDSVQDPPDVVYDYVFPGEGAQAEECGVKSSEIGGGSWVLNGDDPMVPSVEEFADCMAKNVCPTCPPEQGSTDKTKNKPVLSRVIENYILGDSKKRSSLGIRNQKKCQEGYIPSGDTSCPK